MQNYLKEFGLIELLEFQTKIPLSKPNDIIFLKQKEKEFEKDFEKRKNRSKTEKKRKKTTPQFDL